MRYIETAQRRVTHIVTTVPNRTETGYDRWQLGRGSLRTMCGSYYDPAGLVDEPRLPMCPRCERVADSRRTRIERLEADL